MSDRDTLAALVARVEKATGPDESLDAAIGRAMGLPIESWHNGRWYEEDNNAVSHPLPRYTASLDAALTVYPGRPPFVIHSEPRLALRDALRARMEGER